MIDSPNGPEISQIDPQEKMNLLIGEVTSRKPEEVSFLTRALVAVELAKDAVDGGNLTPQQALVFANSLCDFNAVPVVIGTPECKLFPIGLIMEARLVIIKNYRKAAAEAGMNLDDRCKEFRAQAQGVSDLLEIGSDWLDKKYGPFKLSPNDAQAEIMAKVKSNAAAQQILSGESGPDQSQVEAVDSFMKLNLANFIAGQELIRYIEQNYQAR